MHRLVVLPAARDDLLEIGDFIAQDNSQRAASYIDEFEQRLTRIAERPGSYPLRDDLHVGLRSARHGPYMIFFVERGEEIQIVRVLHGARNLARLLG